MKIIGKTLEGDLIIQVSQAEWDGLGEGVRPRQIDFWQTEVRNLLFDAKPGGRWRLFSRLFDKGYIDGTARQLREAIVNNESYLQEISLSQKSLQKYYSILQEKS